MNPLLRSMALLSIAAAQSHAETSPRAPLGTPEPLPPDLPPSVCLLPPAPAPLLPRYLCPRCGEGADTPKRCRPCGAKMARRRGGR